MRKRTRDILQRGDPRSRKVLFCVFACGDKLSGRCEYALRDAAAHLERAIAALTCVANECEEDLGKYCAAVPAGEGRLLDCLQKNERQTGVRFKQALQDVGMK